MREPLLEWRLLEDGITDPFLHFAVEETLLRRVAEGRSVPTFRLRQVVRSVFVGVFQDPREDVDLDYCRAQGIPIVRRPNPGGAVYQDQGTFCTSAFFPKDPSFARMGIQRTGDLYGLMGRVVTAWCAEFGVVALAAPVNDVEAGGRKLYGSAQVEWGAAVVHSGTFLVDADIAAMEGALKPSRLKFADKGFASVRARVVNLCEAAGRPLSLADCRERLVAQLPRVLPVHLEAAPLTTEELEDAERLCETKYARDSWNFPTRRPFATTLATKAASGVVMLDLTREAERITCMNVRGDFLVARQEVLADALRRVEGLTLSDAAALFGSTDLPPDLVTAVVSLLEEAGQRPGS